MSCIFIPKLKLLLNIQFWNIGLIKNVFNNIVHWFVGNNMTVSVTLTWIYFNSQIQMKGCVYSLKSYNLNIIYIYEHQPQTCNYIISLV